MKVLVAVLVFALLMCMFVDIAESRRRDNPEYPSGLRYDEEMGVFKRCAQTGGTCSKSKDCCIVTAICSTATSPKTCFYG
uniref:Alpha-actitoxin-Ms11a-4 n=1 Tax=Metridium senile TaxID=6116 RepID=AITX4_METSE|nr:RecName: Full=Alpha-actitoxin-Ms11a-4; Short=Alpha-AITX-Ms11a-4; AltName: Full=Alpha-anmTX-Ms11a-4; Flags: Precursor [Metridium senile]WCB99798.1 nAChR-binding peptide Ms11-4 [Metridium senile]